MIVAVDSDLELRLHNACCTRDIFVMDLAVFLNCDDGDNDVCPRVHQLWFFTAGRLTRNLLPTSRAGIVTYRAGHGQKKPMTGVVLSFLEITEFFI